MIYIDTSAVRKLVHPEAESGALRTWLASHPDDLVSSALVRTEARRALLRNDPGALPELPAFPAARRCHPALRSQHAADAVEAALTVTAALENRASQADALRAAHVERAATTPTSPAAVTWPSTPPTGWSPTPGKPA